MRFYKKQHKYYCGIDLHARKMYVCIVDQKGKTKVHQNIKTDPDLFLKLISIAKFRFENIKQTIHLTSMEQRLVVPRAFT